MKKYIIEAVCISILLICSTFVSSTGNITDDKYNYNSYFEYCSQQKTSLKNCNIYGKIAVLFPWFLILNHLLDKYPLSRPYNL